ncbi:hypothetical protein [Arthrobacter sp. Z4-13]
MGKQNSQEQPDTYREIMLGELRKRRKLFLDSELEQISLSPNQLVEMLARVLAEKEKPGAERDIDVRLSPIAVRRILNDTPALAEIIRSELGPLRRETIENDAQSILCKDEGLSEADARAAVKAVDSHDRRDIAGSFTRTNKECAERLADLASAHHDRQQGTAGAAQPIMSEEEAQVRGPATTEMFYRAVEPAIGDAEIAAIIGPALEALPGLDRDLRQPTALTQQLASRKLLRAGQESQLKAETATRRYFPFGLIRPRSLAIVAAAVYLVRAQAADGIVRAARPLDAGAHGLAALFIRTFNDLSLEVVRKAKSDSAKGWNARYNATPGALDCLRAAAPVISAGEVPDFLRVPPAPQRSPHPDPAHRLLQAALPLDESGSAAWACSRWNPFGQRLLHRINKEQYIQQKNSLFHDEEFESVAGQLPGLILTELIRRLQRGEGLGSGLPNSRETYQHTSILSLNKFLTVASVKPFDRAFKAYRSSLFNRKTKIRTGAGKPSQPLRTAVNVPRDLPSGVVLLTLDSVRYSIEKILSTVEEHDWACTQFEDPSALPAETLRMAAGEMLEVCTWAEINQAVLTGMSLDEILCAYHDHHTLLGNPSPESEDAILLRALIFDTILTDSAVKDILNNLAATGGEQKETGHEH